MRNFVKKNIKYIFTLAFAYILIHILAVHIVHYKIPIFIIEVDLQIVHPLNTLTSLAPRYSLGCRGVSSL